MRAARHAAGLAAVAAVAVLAAGCGGGAPRQAAGGAKTAAAATPLEAAIAHVGLAGRDAARSTATATTSAEGGTTASATVALDGLLDDSTRSVRWLMEEERQADGTWKVVSSREERRCRPGRGHEDWSTRPCS